MNQRACRRTRFRERPEDSDIDRVMFLYILNRRAASGVHTAHSHREIAARIAPKLDNVALPINRGTAANESRQPHEILNQGTQPGIRCRHVRRALINHAHDRASKARRLMLSWSHETMIHAYSWVGINLGSRSSSCREFVRNSGARIIDEQATEYQRARLRPGNGRTRAIGFFGR
jgi:hypothetical protein